MIVKTLLAAIVAGLIAGTFMTAAQEMRVVPLILEAETYEGQEEPASAPSAAPAGADHAHAHVHEDAAHEEGGMLFGMNRFSGTLVANLVAGAGFGLLLAGIGTLTGALPTLATGLAWGAFGWLAVHLLPAIGLPPELPGFPAAELADRQAWWLATVLLSAIGLFLVAMRREPLAKGAGLVLIALPHLYGAPQPGDIASPVPAVLGAEFAVAALSTTLAFWLVLGLLSGWINDRVLKAA